MLVTQDSQRENSQLTKVWGTSIQGRQFGVHSTRTYPGLWTVILSSIPPNHHHTGFTSPF